jgi:hypothetical protein
MPFIKHGVPVDLQQIDVCPVCKKPKEECICEKQKKESSSLTDQSNGIHKESNGSRELLHRKSN